MRRPCLALLLASACQSPPDDLRTWKPSDHTNRGESQAVAPDRPKQSTGQPRTTIPGLDEVTLATWRANCVVCHGTVGRGDGPQAPMFKPKDLTDGQWQASVTDEQIYEVIQKGRNKMPGFALPESVAQNLVQLIRLLGGRRPTPAAPPADAPAAAAEATSGRDVRTTATPPRPQAAPPRPDSEPEALGAGAGGHGPR